MIIGNELFQSQISTVKVRAQFIISYITIIARPTYIFRRLGENTSKSHISTLIFTYSEVASKNCKITLLSTVKYRLKNNHQHFAILHIFCNLIVD